MMDPFVRKGKPFEKYFDISMYPGFHNKLNARVTEKVAATIWLKSIWQYYSTRKREWLLIMWSKYLMNWRNLMSERLGKRITIKFQKSRIIKLQAGNNESRVIGNRKMNAAGVVNFKIHPKMRKCVYQLKKVAFLGKSVSAFSTIRVKDSLTIWLLCRQSSHWELK